MARTTQATTDKELGFGLLFGLLAAGGAIAMVAAPVDLLAAWGFAAAVIAGCVLIVAVHAYA